MKRKGLTSTGVHRAVGGRKHDGLCRRGLRLEWIKRGCMDICEVDNTQSPGKPEGILLLRVHGYVGGGAVGAEEGSWPED